MKAVFVLLLSGCLALRAAEPAQPAPAPAEDPSVAGLTKVAEALLGKNGGDRLFYLPTRDCPHTPKDVDLKFEDVDFVAADGVKLHGWFLPSTAKVTLGTVVYSHGNAGSLAYHIGGFDWLVKEGYHVFAYDYRGYGRSAGAPGREGTMKDLEAAIEAVGKRPDVDSNKVVAMGHSLGGAISLATLGRNGGKGVRAVVTVGAFASYQDMAGVLARGLGRNMVSDDLSPVDLVGGLKVPVLLLHGVNDPVVPVSQGRRLLEAARGDKRLVEVKNGGHMEVFEADEGAYRKVALEWLAAKLR